MNYVLFHKYIKILVHMLVKLVGMNHLQFFIIIKACLNIFLLSSPRTTNAMKPINIFTSSYLAKKFFIALPF